MPARELGSLAARQLAAWQELARDWVLVIRQRETGIHLTCRACTTTITPLGDNRGGYMMTIDMMMSATVAHLRNVHRDLDPEVRNGEQDA